MAGSAVRRTAREKRRYPRTQRPRHTAAPSPHTAVHRAGAVSRVRREAPLSVPPGEGEAPSVPSAASPTGGRGAAGTSSAPPGRGAVWTGAPPVWAAGVGNSSGRRHPEGHPEGQAQPQQHQQPEVVTRCPAQPPAEDPLQQQHHAGEQGPQHCQAQQRLQQRAHVSPPPFSSHRASNMARSSPTSSRFRACRSTRAATIALALPA